MNLLNSIAPKEKNRNQIEAINLASFKHLDSGEIVSINIENSQPGKIIEKIPLLENSSNIEMFLPKCSDFYSFYNSYKKLDSEHQDRFWLKRAKMYFDIFQFSLNTKIQYLSSVFQKRDFYIPVYDETGQSQDTSMIGSIYYQNNNVIIPPEFKFIINDILNILNLDANIQIITESQIIDFPRNKKIQDKIILSALKNTDRSNFCRTCIFNTICDQK